MNACPEYSWQLSKVKLLIENIDISLAIKLEWKLCLAGRSKVQESQDYVLNTNIVIIYCIDADLPTSSEIFPTRWNFHLLIISFFLGGGLYVCFVVPFYRCLHVMLCMSMYVFLLFWIFYINNVCWYTSVHLFVNMF